MAPVHRIKCERCGRVVRGDLHYITMKTGVYAMVCSPCRNTLASIFRAGRRVGLPDPEKLYPALWERVTPPHG